VGRLNRWKGQDLLLKAVALIKDRGIRCAVTIVGGEHEGSTETLKALTTLADTLGISDWVEFAGEQHDLDPFYSTADMFVSPSTSPEPFGLVVVEAMSYGVPVIAARPGGPSETVVDGVTGLLFDNGDVNGLADALEMLINNHATCQAMGLAGRARSTNFSSTLTAAGYWTVLDEVRS
jgi:glycosyltransferase involved in cell wall biosynthesis